MQPAPMPKDDAERVADLHSYEILEAPSDPALDRIAALAAMICGTERASITLLDRDRQWFKASYGPPCEDIQRIDSICGHAILHRRYFEVPDVQADPRFADNRVLRDAEVRFYGGSQLVNARGHALGVLCVHDSSPRTLDESQRTALDHLATVVVSLMESHRRGRRLAWFGRLVDEVNDEIFVADAQTWKYLHVNQTGVNHSGYSLDELRLRTPVDITPSLTSEQFRGFVQRLEAGEPVIVYEGIRQRADGTTYDVEIRLRRVDASHRPVLVSQVTDISERKAMARLKDEFVSVVSHELRTPLTAMHGALRLLESGVAGALPEDAARLVGLAADGSRRLRSIVDDILDLEQIAAGRMLFDTRPLQADALLRTVAAGFEANAAAAGVQLVVDPAPALGLLGDERRVQQVVGNLVSNALKFAPPGSTVRLAAVATDGAVRLTVEDAGPGIPDEFRPRIFQRFAQADMGNTRVVGGSGLGLSIVKRLTEQMDGQAGFESRPGHTVFHVEFPAVAA
jgi:PAS domain S-box-containing protein